MGNTGLFSFRFRREDSSASSPVPTPEDYGKFHEDLKLVEYRLDAELIRFKHESDTNPSVDASDLAAWECKLEQLRGLQLFLKTDRASMATLEFKQTIRVVANMCDELIAAMKEAMERPPPRPVRTASELAAIRRLVRIVKPTRVTVIIYAAYVLSSSAYMLCIW